MNKIILIVCVGNAGRSQMAEGFFNSKYAPKGYRAISGDTRSANQINPIAIEVMNEVGIDISKQNSKMVKEDRIRSCSKAVNMGCIQESECPMLFIHDIVDWGIEDPKVKPLKNVRKIRNEIERRVKEFAESIQESNSQ